MKKSKKLEEFTFPMVNMKSDKAFTATIKGVDRNDAERKAKIKFPYPTYKFEWQ